MFASGNGFTIQKIEAKGKKCLLNWERLEENEVKPGGNGNLGWQKRKRRCIQKNFNKGSLR